MYNLAHVSGPTSDRVLLPGWKCCPFVVVCVNIGVQHLDVSVYCRGFQ